MKTAKELVHLPPSPFKPGDKGMITLAEDGYWDSIVPIDGDKAYRWRLTSRKSRKSHVEKLRNYYSRRELWNAIEEGAAITITRAKSGWEGTLSSREIDGVITAKDYEPLMVIDSLAKQAISRVEILAAT